MMIYLFNEVLTKPLIIGGDVLPDGITDKSGRSTLNTGQTLHMNNNGESSKTSSVYGPNASGGSNKASSSGVNPQGNIVRPGWVNGLNIDLNTFGFGSL